MQPGDRAKNGGTLSLRRPVRLLLSVTRPPRNGIGSGTDRRHPTVRRVGGCGGAAAPAFPPHPSLRLLGARLSSRLSHVRAMIPCLCMLCVLHHDYELTWVGARREENAAGRWDSCKFWRRIPRIGRQVFEAGYKANAAVHCHNDFDRGFGIRIECETGASPRPPAAGCKCAAVDA